MNNNKYDRLIWEITRPMWFLLSLVAVYTIYKSVQMLHAASAVDVDINLIYGLIEHLLAGCVVTTAIGAVFEYITLKSGNARENE